MFAKYYNLIKINYQQAFTFYLPLGTGLNPYKSIFLSTLLNENKAMKSL